MSDLKNEIDLMDYHFSNGMSMWPYYRYNILSAGCDVISVPHSTNTSRIKKIKNLLFGIKHIKLKKANIVFFTSTLFNVLDRSGKYINILDDYYANEFSDKSYIFEDKDAQFYWRFPRKNNNVSTIISYLVELSFLIAKLNIFHKANQSVRDFQSIHSGLLDYKIVIKHDTFIIVYCKLLRIFLRFVQPKLIVVNCGCYGDISAITIKVAKSLGIKTAEIQHGIPGAIAYNYSEILISSTNYGEYLPDYVFTFGEYWNECMNIPCEKVIIGHPHLNIIASQKDIHNSKIQTILFVSQPTIHMNLLMIAKELSQLLPKDKFRLIFRIHPMEVATDSLLADLSANNISLSTSLTDLYDDFRKSNFVCGVYSLCLFEAIAFRLKIFVVENELSSLIIPAEVGLKVKNANDIVRCLNFKTEDLNVERYWAKSFTSNYQKFIHKLNILNN